MKTSNHKASQLLGNNRVVLETELKKAGIPPGRVGVLVLVADMLDEIVAGRNMWMIISSTTNKSAFSVTIKGDDAPDAIYASSLLELGQLAMDLL